MKAYTPEGHADTATTQWSDSSVTFMEVLDRGFPVQAAMWSTLIAPILAEFSGIIVFPSQGVYTLLLSCEGWCNFLLYGSLLAESKSGEEFNDATAQFSVLVEKPGPFPYRILYRQDSGSLRLGLRWSVASTAFEDVPAQRLFTDAHMENPTSAALLTGSVAGVFIIQM